MYVRSRSGLGRGGLGQISLVNTMQPITQTTAVTQNPMIQMTAGPALQTPETNPLCGKPGYESFTAEFCGGQAAQPAAVIMSGNYPVCRDPSKTTKDGWGWENNQSCKKLNYPFCSSYIDKAGTGWGWENNQSCIVPIKEGTHRAPPASSPVNPIEAATFYPVATQQAIATMSSVAAAAGAAGSTPYVKPPTGLPGQDSGGDTGAVGQVITPEVFAASCKQLNGKMGTNCCKFPNGVMVGLNAAGQMVKVSSCDTGLGNLPLIAAAVVGAFLISRML